MMIPIRTLMPNEMPRYRDHLLRLGVEDRRLRFGHVMGDDAIAAFVDGMDTTDCRVLAHMDADLAVVGAVHVSVCDRRMAEIAFSVAPGWRGQGLGTRLAERAVLWARNRGVRRLVLSCLPENRAMRRVAARIGMDLHMEAGNCEAAVTVPMGTPLSALKEIALENAAFHDLSVRANYKAALGGFRVPAPERAA